MKFAEKFGSRSARSVWSAPAERSVDGAFETGRTFFCPRFLINPKAVSSLRSVTTLQTLRDNPGRGARTSWLAAFQTYYLVSLVTIFGGVFGNQAAPAGLSDAVAIGQQPRIKPDY